MGERMAQSPGFRLYFRDMHSYEKFHNANGRNSVPSKDFVKGWKDAPQSVRDQYESEAEDLQIPPVMEYVPETDEELLEAAIKNHTVRAGTLTETVDYSGAAAQFLRTLEERKQRIEETS